MQGLKYYLHLRSENIFLYEFPKLTIVGYCICFPVNVKFMSKLFPSVNAAGSHIQGLTSRYFLVKVNITHCFCCVEEDHVDIIYCWSRHQCYSGRLLSRVLSTPPSGFLLRRRARDAQTEYSRTMFHNPQQTFSRFKIMEFQNNLCLLHILFINSTEWSYEVIS